MSSPKFLQTQSFTISASGASSGDTTLLLQSFKYPDGTTNIVTADLGDKKDATSYINKFGITKDEVFAAAGNWQGAQAILPPTVIDTKDAAGNVINRWSQDRAFDPNEGFVEINPAEFIVYSEKVPTSAMKAGETYTIEASLAGQDGYITSTTVTPLP